MPQLGGASLLLCMYTLLATIALIPWDLRTSNFILAKIFSVEAERMNNFPPKQPRTNQPRMPEGARNLTKVCVWALSAEIRYPRASSTKSSMGRKPGC